METLYPPLTTGSSDIKSDGINHAADALRDILNRLPITKTTSNTKTTADTHSEQNPTKGYSYEKPIVQYEIPSDPSPNLIPPFIPIKNSVSAVSNSPSIYGLPVGPIESITQTKTITTAYGAPLSQHAVDPEKWMTIPVSQNDPNPKVELFQPLSLYHTMTLKLAKTNKTPNHILDTTYLSPPPIDGHDYTSAGLTAIDNSWRKSMSPDYTIEKSIGYELRPPPPVVIHQKRRYDIQRRRHY